MRSSYGRPPSGNTNQFLGGMAAAGGIGTVLSPVAAACTAIASVAFNASATHVRYAIASLAISATVTLVSSIARRFTKEAEQNFSPALAGFVLGGAVILQGANIVSSQWEDEVKASAPPETSCTPAPHH